MTKVTTKKNRNTPKTTTVIKKKRSTKRKNKISKTKKYLSIQYNRSKTTTMKHKSMPRKPRKFNKNPQ